MLVNNKVKTKLYKKRSTCRTTSIYQTCDPHSLPCPVRTCYPTIRCQINIYYPHLWAISEQFVSVKLSAVVYWSLFTYTPSIKLISGGSAAIKLQTTSFLTHIIRNKTFNTKALF